MAETPMPAEVAQDYSRLRAYAELQFEYAARVAGAGSHADEVVPPEIPAAYSDWLGFLGRVAKARAHGGVTSPLRADVAHGLEAVEDARNRFLAKHRQCGRCGKFMPRFTKVCTCGEKF
jgi:ribosomal protein S27AE